MVSLIFLPLLTLAAKVSGLDIPISVIVPRHAVEVSPSLLSFSIEQDRWTDWVGTTVDHTDFAENVEFSQAIFPAPSSTVPYPEATNITVGNGYYETAKFLPPGTHVVWGVNLGQNNVTAAVLEATSIKRAFDSDSFVQSGIVLDAIEIGNEPDLYMNNGLRPRSYTSSQYTDEWTTFAAQVADAAGVTNSSHTKFWGAGFAGSSHTNSGFSPQAIFSEGILDTAPGSLISTISQHRYSGSFCTGSGGLLQDLMTKATIRGNLTIFTPDISASRGLGLDYVLGETNSYSCHGAPGVSNTAGAALWTLDYALFASQIGISRVFFHQGIGFKYNLVQPVTLTRSILNGSALPEPLAPHVQPQYYAAIIIAEAVGKKGATRAVELDIDDPRISGYAFYDSLELTRVVLINSEAYFSGDGERPKTHINFQFPANRRVEVKRLNVGFADDDSGITWGGQSYESESGRPSGSFQTESIWLENGVDISATEAILLCFS
ncbi:glycoside hydrolase family 79 protein [Cyathus striatus]|nr:glycoside hydrolase family 79 protein [Cyathus striatus]